MTYRRPLAYIFSLVAIGVSVFALLYNGIGCDGGIKPLFAASGTCPAADSPVFARGFVANEDGADSDSRIEGDTDANLVYVDAGNNRVGVGTASPSTKFHVANGTSTFVGLAFTSLESAADLKNFALTNLNVDSGAVDGTTIGGTSAAAGTFTTGTITTLLVGSGDANLQNNDLLNVGNANSDCVAASCRWAQPTQFDNTVTHTSGSQVVSQRPAWLQISDSDVSPRAYELLDSHNDLTNNTAISFIRVTVPNTTRNAQIFVDYIVTDAVQTKALAGQIHVAVIRTTNETTGTAIATSVSQLAADTASPVTLTATFGVTSPSGATSTTQTFDIQVTANDATNGTPPDIRYRARLLEGNGPDNVAAGITFAAQGAPGTVAALLMALSWAAAGLMTSRAPLAGRIKQLIRSGSMKPARVLLISVLMAIAFGAGAVVVAHQRDAEAAPNSAPGQAELAAVLASMTDDDTADHYDRGHDVQTCAGAWMNADHALRQDVIPGTDIALTLDQRTALGQAQLDGMACVQKRLNEAAAIGGLSRSQLDTVADLVPAKLTRREIQATATASR